MTSNRNECGFVSVNGKFYLIGGDGGEVKTVDCLDPKTRTWTTLAKAPEIKHHSQAVALENKIYVLDAFSTGGSPISVNTSYHERGNFMTFFFHKVLESE